MKTLHANISVVSGHCFVCEYDMYTYHVKNVSGLQYCFKGHIYDDECLNYNNRYNVGLMFPIQLFMGKKDGDQVKLSYSYTNTVYDKELVEFDLIVTCRSKHNTFEHDLYNRISNMDYYCHFNINKNIQNLIAYNTQFNYCKSLNLPMKMNLKTYEPIMLTDYIDIDNKDVLTLIKPIYYLLFINQKSNFLKIITQ